MVALYNSSLFSGGKNVAKCHITLQNIISGTFFPGKMQLTLEQQLTKPKMQHFREPLKACKNTLLNIWVILEHLSRLETKNITNSLYVCACTLRSAILIF